MTLHCKEEPLMYRQVIEKAAEKMKKTTSVYQEDLRSIRAGRANPQFLERVTVDYYGVQTPLTQMGNITSPEPRMLVINVWDQKAIPMVEKAILKSDLGLNPTNDGKIIRLVVPELNEERRKELTKLVRKGAEESKVAIRSIRRDAMEQFKKLEKDGLITEDDYQKFDTIVAEKFGIPARSIWRDIHLIKLPAGGNMPPTKGGISGGTHHSTGSANEAG